jgi:hypothetical protein
MMGFLYYAKYKESNKTQFVLASKRLVQQSLNLESSCIKLRGATFFLTNMEYRQAIAICNTFLTSPPRYTIDSFLQYIIDIESKLNEQLFQGKTNEAIETMKKHVCEITEYPNGIMLCAIVVCRQILQFDGTIKHW